MRILVAINDPGGGQAMLPVLLKLIGDTRYQVNVIAGGVAQEILTNAGLSFQEEVTGSWQRCQELFAQIRPQLLLTATSWQSNLEQELRNQAHRLGVESIVVLDFWNNYALRFSGSSYRLADCPDCICLPDERVVAEMIVDGFPASSLEVTGQPFLEEMFNGSSQRGDRERSHTVLFLSQPSVVDGKTISRFADLEVVVKALRQKRVGQRPLLEIKLHPKEEVSSDLLAMVAKLNNDFCMVRLLPSSSVLADCFLRVDSVVGYYSMALFEARALGKKAISLQGYEVNSSLSQAMEAVGILDLPLTEEAICQALNNDDRQNFPKDVHSGACQKILNLVARKIDRQEGVL